MKPTTEKLDELLIALYGDKQMSPREITLELQTNGFEVTFNQIGHRLGRLGILRSLKEEINRPNRYKAKKICPFCHGEFTGTAARKYCTTCVPGHQAGQRASTFGISQPEFDALLVKQNYACGICKRDLRVLCGRQVMTDHCHLTDEIRGILCTRCNVMLRALDEVGWLLLAQQYLQEQAHIVPLWKR